jgi:hypothetical protein
MKYEINSVNVLITWDKKMFTFGLSPKV